MGVTASGCTLCRTMVVTGRRRAELGGLDPLAQSRLTGIDRATIARLGDRE
jgi:hypothetical protein